MSIDEVTLMKIAQVVVFFPPYIEAAGIVSYHNSLELAKLGHEVTIFTTRFSNMDYNYSEPFKVRRLKPIFRIGYAPFLPQLLGLRGFDVIHLHYPYHFGGEFIYLVSKWRKQKYVLTYHQDAVHPGQYQPFLKAHRATLLKTVVNGAAKICVTTLDYAQHSQIKDIIARRTGDVVEMPNGVDINRFNPDVDGSGVREQYGMGKAKVILIVTTLDKVHYYKGMEYLLKAFTKVEDARLLIVGGGNLRGYYQGLAQKIGIANRVIFAGSVPDELLPAHYAASDILALPSIDKGEAFGMPLIEAMAVGKPVIASNIPGVRTVVGDGQNGLLIEPKNPDELASKINFLLQNEDIRKRFGRNGREKVLKRYTWERIGAKLETVYQEVVGC